MRIVGPCSLSLIKWTDPAARLGVEIRRPDGTLVTDGVLGAEVFSTNTHYTARVGTVGAGTWSVTLRGAIGWPEYIGKLSGKNQQRAQVSMYFGEYHGDPGLLAQRGRFLRGLPMPILASLTDRSGPLRDADVVAAIEHPDGRVLDLPLLDDGNHGDGNADDGIYGNFYTLTTAASTRRGPPEDPNPQRGSYNVRLEAKGKDNSGGAYTRIKKGSFQVFDGANREQKDLDADKDGMPTRYEELQDCLDPATFDADKDGDADGVLNGEEYKAGTNPCNPDTDGGGESDFSELKCGAHLFDPRDDALPRPIDVEVINWVLDRLPRPDIRPNSNLIRYPVNPAYEKIRLLRSTNPNGPFVEVAVFGARDGKGLYHDDGLTNGTTYYYQVQGVDNNGNLSAPSHIFRGRPQADSIPPIGHVMIDLHRTLVAGPHVRLSLFIDPEPGIGVDAHDLAQEPEHSEPVQIPVGHEVLASNTSSFEDAKWQPYAPTLEWDLAPDPKTGEANVFVKFRDAAGNESTLYHDEVVVRPQGSLGGIRGKALLKGQRSHAGIQVFVIGDGSVAPAMTDASGAFVLGGLAPGTYSLRFAHDSFGSAVVRNVKIAAGATTEIKDVIVQLYSIYAPLIAR